MGAPTSMSWDDLLRALRRGQRVRVTWDVRPCIGPEWIGGGRRIDVFVDDATVEGEGAERLTAALVEWAGLPEEREREVITGEADIELNGAVLELDYGWSVAIPYEYGGGEDEGQAPFYDVESDTVLAVNARFPWMS